MVKKLVILSLILVAFSMLPLVARAAILYLIPQSETIYQNDFFIVEVRLDTEGEEINTVETNLKSLPDFLKIVDVNKGGSILSLWIQEPSIIKEEEISFIGGAPGGFKGDGLIGRITFLGKEVGKTVVNFKEDSKVLLNDGKGTPAKLNSLKGNYEILERPEKLYLISSKTHPEQNKWYKSNTLHLHWDLAENTEYSYILSKDPLAEIDETPDKPEGELIWMGDMEYANLEDGIYYFHLKQGAEKEEGKTVWGPKITFRAMIDGTAPEPFKPEIGRDPSIFEGKYFLSFSASDETSDIDHYEISEMKGNKEKIEWKTGKSPYLLKDQTLRSKILVKVVDRAGNERIVEIQPTKRTDWQQISNWGLLVLATIGLIGILLAVFKKLKRRHRV